MFKFKNVTELRTTIPASVIAIFAILMAFGVVTPEENDVIIKNSSLVLNGLFSLYLAFTK